MLIRKENTQLTLKKHGEDENVVIEFSLMDKNVVLTIHFFHQNLTTRIHDNRYATLEHYQHLIPLAAEITKDREEFIKEPRGFLEQRSWKVKSLEDKENAMLTH